MIFNYRQLRIVIGVAFTALSSAGEVSYAQTSANVSEWVEIGDANWEVTSDQISANAGSGFLVTSEIYDNFVISVKFKPGADTNSGIFLRCSDRENISDKTCYEVNIFDRRPDPSGRTGSIVNVSSPLVSINTEERWNTYEISAQGNHLVVKLNGVVTVDTHDDRLTQGVIALQRAAGEITFKDLSINRGINKSAAIKGVWKLTRFGLDDGRGNIQSWCEGAYGTIIYTSDYMSVAINCSSNENKKILYSGPYHLQGQYVVHDVKNSSDASLAQKFLRKVEMPNESQLDLVGPFGEGGKAVVSWERLRRNDSAKRDGRGEKVLVSPGKM